MLKRVGAQGAGGVSNLIFPSSMLVIYGVCGALKSASCPNYLPTGSELSFVSVNVLLS